MQCKLHFKMKPTHLLPGVWSEVLQSNKIQEFVTLIEVMDIRTQSQVFFFFFPHNTTLATFAILSPIRRLSRASGNEVKTYIALTIIGLASTVNVYTLEWPLDIIGASGVYL